VFSFFRDDPKTQAKVLLIPSIIAALLDPARGAPPVLIVRFPPRGLVVLVGQENTKAMLLERLAVAGERQNVCCATRPAPYYLGGYTFVAPDDFDDDALASRLDDPVELALLLIPCGFCPAQAGEFAARRTPVM